MSDIFISYTREDADRAKQIAQALTSHGWSVWWDRVIPAGRVFDEVIEEAIDGAKCIVVLWSTKSVSSAWVKTEATEGADRHILVPVLLEDVRIPLAFRRIQAADLRDWQGQASHSGLAKLVEDISAIIGPPSSVPSTKPETAVVEPRVGETKDEATIITSEEADKGRRPQGEVSPQSDVAGGDSDPLSDKGGAVSSEESHTETTPRGGKPEASSLRTRHSSRSRLLVYSLFLVLVIAVGAVVVNGFIVGRPADLPISSRGQVNGQWELKAPDVTANGAVVPVTLKGELQRDESLRLVSENGCWYSETESSSTAIVTTYSVRLKMGKTDELIGVIDKGNGETEKARKRVTVKEGAGTPCSNFSRAYTVNAADRVSLSRVAALANQEDSSTKLRVKAQDSGFTLKALMTHPMAPDTFIRALGVYVNGESVAFVAWSPLISKNPYLSLQIRGVGKPGNMVNLAWLDNRGGVGVSATKPIK